MRKRFSIVSLFAAASLMAAFTACTSSPVQNDQAFSEAELAGLPYGSGMLRDNGTPPPEDPVDAEPVDNIESTIQDGINGIMISKTTLMKAGAAYSEHMLFNPYSNVVYPGNVLIGNNIDNGEYKHVRNVEVNPITITASLTSETPGFYSRTVERMKYSEYLNVLNDWRQRDFKDPGVETTLENIEITNEKDASFKAGASFQAEAVKIAASMDGEHKRLKTHVLCKFVQKVFSVSMDDPEGGLIRTANMAAFQGVQPVYISDVSYGRMAYILVSSNRSSDDVKAALNVMVPAANLGVEADAKYRSLLSDARVTATFIGGSAAQHGQILTNGWEGVKASLAAPMSVSTTMPIAFTLRYVHDNSIAKVLLMGEYPKTISHFVADCKSVNLGIHITDIKARAGLLKNKNVYGKAIMELPNGEKVTLMDTDPKHHFVIDKDDEFVNISSMTTPVSVRIDRAKNMSMKDFLQQKVVITTEFYNTGAFGIVKGSSVGGQRMEYTLYDLFFNSLEGQSVDMSMRANRLLEYSCTVRFKPTVTTNK
ncbi:MAG: thiol-activated cytolysin family protein [Bacteroidales bacterium]|nr:thiol-activated cytolysin family protein [Porphyromonas sp.]MDD6933726.1 thiol-activated cytolysin family protein [Bacteroidales bacterium]MDY3101917.1 thiol-activated cytolysin family protein [Porphyromonas sp.]